MIVTEHIAFDKVSLTKSIIKNIPVYWMDTGRTFKNSLEQSFLYNNQDSSELEPNYLVRGMYMLKIMILKLLLTFHFFK